MLYLPMVPLPPVTGGSVTFTYTVPDDTLYISVWRLWLGELANPDNWIDSPFDDESYWQTASVFGAIVDSELRS